MRSQSTPKTVIVPLTQGKVAIIDACDADRVLAHKWWAVCSRGIWYAQGKQDGKRIHLHRFIMDAPPGFEVDHRNRNGLDCRRENMRVATRGQNNMNQGLRSDNTSGYKGVKWHRQHKRWNATIMKDGKNRSLGLYDTAEEAARIYDKFARDLFGEFAYLNFPDANHDAS